MLAIIRSILSPLLSLVILVIGNGLSITYVTLRLSLDGQSTEIIGIVTAAYYAGMFIGSIRANKLIERIGHIRAFSTFASLTGIFMMLQGFLIDPWFWFALRFLGGVAMAGLFITIESWFLAQSSIETRGKILSLYMIALYGSQAAGQFLLDVADPFSLIPYALVVILSTLSIVPVCITKTTAPISEGPSYLNILQLYKISPVGVIGCFLSGILLGAIYGLNPIYAQEIGLDFSRIATFMGLTILGGLALQWPLGHLSDKMDRRKVLILACFATIIISMVIVFMETQNYLSLLILAWFFGGFSFTIYPISISHACDRVEKKDIIAATGGLLIAYGIGAIIGPVIAPLFMSLFGPKGLFIFFALVCAILAFSAIWKIFLTPPVPDTEKRPYANVPRGAPIATELDPRSEHKE